MKRTVQLALITITLVTLTTCTPANAQSSFVSREIKFSELFPEQASQFREEIRTTREYIENLIRQARARGDYRQANDMTSRGRAYMQQLISDVKASCPPTTLVLHHTADDNAWEQAMQKLRSGQIRPGGTIHLRGRNTGNQSGVGNVVQTTPTGKSVGQRARQSAPHVRQSQSSTHSSNSSSGNAPSHSGLNVGGGGASLPVSTIKLQGPAGGLFGT